MKKQTLISILFLSVLFSNAFADTVTEPIRTLSGHVRGVYSVAFSPNGQYILSGGWDKTLKLWDVNNGTEIRSFSGHSSGVNSVAFSPDGQYVLSGSIDDTLQLWDVNSGAVIHNFSGHTDNIMSVIFSPNTQYVLSGSRDNTLKLWDVNSGTEVRSFTGHTEGIYSVAFSPDGQYALSGSSPPENVLKLWNVNNGEEIRTFSGHTDYVMSVTFSPNGQYALSGSLDRRAKLWDVNSGTEIYTFGKHTGGINSVAFSHDGQYALSGSYDQTLKLWDVDSGEQIRTFSGHTDVVSSVAFSPDGQYAVSGSWDETLKLWDTGLGSSQRANVSPNASFTVSPPQGTDFVVTLDASSSYDPDGSIVKYDWTLGSGIIYNPDGTALSSIVLISNDKITTTSLNEGSNTIGLTVTDNQGATDTRTQTIIAESSFQSPTASFTALPSQGEKPLAVTLDANGSYDPDGTIVTYDWLVNGQPISLATDTPNFSVANASVDMLSNTTVTRKTVTITFKTEGNYTVGLTVTDNDGLTAQTQQMITVTNPKQAPIANFTVSPMEGIAPLTVALDTSDSYDPDGTIEKYEWFVNEQPTSLDLVASLSQQMTFNVAGSYTIKLRVTDNDGLTGQTQQTVTVTQQNLVPDIRIEPTTLRFSQ